MLGKNKVPRLLGSKFKKETRPASIELGLPENRRNGSGIDRIYRIIEDECCRGYVLTDTECGLPYIEKKDIEDRGSGIWYLRFRLKDGMERRLEKVVRFTNYRLLSGLHLICERLVEYGIPFIEEFYLKRDFEGRYRIMSSCATNWDNFFRSNCDGKGIVDVAKFLGYSEENVMFLECQETDRDAKMAIFKKFPNTIKYLNDPMTKSRIGENRTPLQYAKDLIAGWIGEDLFARNLMDNGIEIELNGADSDRRILPATKVSTKPDVSMRVGDGEWRECELMMEHIGFPSKEGIIVFRHYKFNSMVDKKCIFIDLDFSTGKYVIIDFRKGTPKAKFIEKYDNWGGKPAYVVSLSENGIQMREHEKLIDELKKRLSNAKVNTEPLKKTTLDVPTKEEERKMVEKAYEKAAEERMTKDDDETYCTEESTESDSGCESSVDDDISSWESEHSELDGWV